MGEKEAGKWGGRERRYRDGMGDPCISPTRQQMALLERRSRETSGQGTKKKWGWKRQLGSKEGTDLKNQAINTHIHGKRNY